VGLVVFGFHIAYATRYLGVDPLIRPSLFSSSSGLAAYFGSVVHGIIIWVVLYYLPLYALVAKNVGALLAGVSISPSTATVAPSAAVVGLLITKFGRYRYMAWVGWFLVTLGVGLLLRLNKDTEPHEWIPIFMIFGFGLGILYSAQAFAIQAASSNTDLPFAAGMTSFCRCLGQSIGVAVGGVSFQNSFKNQLLNTPYAQYADQWSKDAAAFVQTIRIIGDQNPEMRESVVVSYVNALWVVWTVILGFSVIGLVVTILFIRDMSLDRDLETDQALVNRNSKRLSELPSRSESSMV
jgi:Major Facilitator Superfamily